MISQNIQDLLTMAKAMPNGEWRNKIISHLKDAYASAIVMESYTPNLEARTAQGASKQPNTASTGRGCTCRPGMVDKNCAVHG